jgi:hypothetical protein
VVPFALAGVLLLRYGLSNAINWPFLTFVAVAGLSLAILPIGRVAGFGDMARSFIGSTAPFVVGLASPAPDLDALVRGARWCRSSARSAASHGVSGLLPDVRQLRPLPGPAFGALPGRLLRDRHLRFHARVPARVRLRWLLLGGANLAILLATQARAPFIAVGLFLLLVLVLSGPGIFPLKRKVDLVMGGMVPALLLLGPALLYALQRFTGESENLSGRDIIWPYFLDAIERRPLFGFGLGAGKLIVDPEDPTIKLLGSSAAHNEYLRLAVDAGVIGCAAIFLSIIFWIWSGNRAAPGRRPLVLHAPLVAALLHSGFDNTLIASTSVMQFCFFAAAIARARIERSAHGPAAPAAAPRLEAGRVAGRVAAPGPAEASAPRPPARARASTSTAPRASPSSWWCWPIVARDQPPAWSGTSRSGTPIPFPHAVLPVLSGNGGG